LSVDITDGLTASINIPYTEVALTDEELESSTFKGDPPATTAQLEFSVESRAGLQDPDLLGDAYITWFVTTPDGIVTPVCDYEGGDIALERYPPPPPLIFTFPSSPLQPSSSAHNLLYKDLVARLQAIPTPSPDTSALAFAVKHMANRPECHAAHLRRLQPDTLGRAGVGFEAARLALTERLWSSVGAFGKTHETQHIAQALCILSCGAMAGDSPPPQLRLAALRHVRLQLLEFAGQLVPVILPESKDNIVQLIRDAAQHVGLDGSVREEVKKLDTWVAETFKGLKTLHSLGVSLLYHYLLFSDDGAHLLRAAAGSPLPVLALAFGQESLAEVRVMEV
jgi:hypothetical protein